MIYEFLMSNQQFILGFLATIIVWLIARIFKGASVDKTQIIALLSLVLEIIQDIKTNPETAELSEPEKKALAIEKLELSLPKKKKTLAQKVFGSLGAAVEFVFHNRNALATAAAAIIKKVF